MWRSIHNYKATPLRAHLASNVHNSRALWDVQGPRPSRSSRHDASIVKGIKIQNAMARQRKLVLSQPIKEGLKTFKVRLDHRTVITLSKLEALAFWKQRYPNAQIIS